MEQTDREREIFQPHSRAEWRAWLEQHYATSRGIWLIQFRKSSGKPSVSYDDAVEEALCFGWIDSRRDPLDDERSIQLFTPRKKGSPWSRLNKQRIEKLLAENLMTPVGLAKIDAARQDGSWTIYDAIEDLAIPDDLEAPLLTNPEAHANFHAFSPSVRKQVLWWVASAKRPETRARRIDQIVAGAAENRNPLDYAARRKARAMSGAEE
jgi:uncharacterized protein YdeI (YjbR/CyaY-like superfamily)